MMPNPPNLLEIKDTEIALLKTAYRESIEAYKHKAFCDSVRRATIDVMAENIELLEKMVKERDSELVVLRLITGNCRVMRGSQ